MCGIAGWIDWNNDLTRQGLMMACMADTLCHRGPDAQQNPVYERATRDWTLEILDDANAPVQPLLDTRVVRELAESDAPLPPNLVVSPFERIIQMNEWLRKYEVTLVL